jgi:hypothetical protein
MSRFVFALAFVMGSATITMAQTCEEAEYCGRLRNAEITMQRAGIGLSGGNPVPGASSTLGMRLGALPRLSVAVRFTAARLVITDELTIDPSDEVSSSVRSFNVDASIGIFSGFSLLPTVGGFGSIDLLASYGKLSLSDDDGFAGVDDNGSGDPSSWGLGLRVGILRESFTAPGLSVSGMYRKIGDYGHDTDEFNVDFGPVTQFDNNRALSVRASVGKRILMLGATAGIGYDKYYTDAIFFPTQTPTRPPIVRREVETSATTIFGNVSWTMLILHIVGEGGVQRADGEGAVYGSLAIRLAL